MKKKNKISSIVSRLLLLTAAVLFFSAGQWAAPGTGHQETYTFKLPEYEKFVLNNGLTVYLMEQHEVPLIYVSAVFPAGAVKDNGRYGLASLTAQGLLFGTKNYTKKQIEEKLDFLGASYSARAGRETARLSMSFINTDQDKVFPLLKEIIMYPVFDKNEFEKRKKRLLMELERAKERPSRVIGSYFTKFLFGRHGYGNPASGTPSSAAKIGVNHVEAFYEANYKPGESAVAIVGDFKTPRMKSRVKQLFKEWQVKGKSSKIQQQPLPVINKSRVLLVNKEDATETQFMIGGLGIKRSNPDYIAVQVINIVLGGRFTSWLNDELRINAGLTYGAFSFFSPYKTSGIFAVFSNTRTETTVKAIDLALEVLDRLHRQGIDKKTLSSAKNYIKGQYPPRYETAGSLASLLTSMFVYDFDESFIDDFQKNVDHLTMEKAKKIIARYFPRDKLQLVLIGKASEIRDKVKKYGEITGKEIKADGF